MMTLTTNYSQVDLSKVERMHIDIETYSDIDLKESGVYVYTAHPSFRITLFAYAYGDGPVESIRLAEGQELPLHVVEALHRPKIKKWARNAQFERISINKYFNFHIPIENWWCTMAYAAIYGIPLGLKNASTVIGVSNKIDLPKSIMKYFAEPNNVKSWSDKKWRENNGEFRHFNMPSDDPEKWETFVAYNVQDVVADRDVYLDIAKYPYPEYERKIYIADQYINDTGIAIDDELAKQAIIQSEKEMVNDTIRFQEITGLSSPKCVTALKTWTEEQLGRELLGINKEAISNLLQEKLPDNVREALEIRQRSGKTSIKKYSRMLIAQREDGRAGGFLQYYGARTGRWAGRLVQVQNLPRDGFEKGMLEECREALRKGELDNVLTDMPKTFILSQLIRTAFTAPKNKTLAVADYSSIEARVIAWLSGETWRQEVFSTHGKIYEASASNMFGIPIEKIVKGNPEYEYRAKGKVAELALGYQGGVGALTQMGGKKMGLSEEEMQNIVYAWRDSNPNIVKFWHQVQDNFIAKTTGQLGKYRKIPNLDFLRKDGHVFIKLPSGRYLTYRNARYVHREGKRFKELQYLSEWGEGAKRVGYINTYGGKLVENIVQAVARDLIAESLVKLREAGFKVVMHVHDEIVAEVDEATAEAELKLMEDIMNDLPAWAEGLILGSDGFISKFYRK